MSPLKPGAALPVLLDHEADHAGRVADMVDDALGSCRHPTSLRCAPSCWRAICAGAIGEAAGNAVGSALRGIMADMPPSP